MTQDAVVTRCYDNGMAEVSVTRMTACGNNCGSCESCIYQNELKTLAVNTVNASCGQEVVIESRTSAVFGAAALVYIFPLFLFILGYFCAYVLGATEGICVLVSFIMLLVSAAIIVLLQKQKGTKQMIYDIIEIKGSNR